MALYKFNSIIIKSFNCAASILAEATASVASTVGTALHSVSFNLVTEGTGYADFIRPHS